MARATAHSVNIELCVAIILYIGKSMFQPSGSIWIQEVKRSGKVENV